VGGKKQGVASNILIGGAISRPKNNRTILSFWNDDKNHRHKNELFPELQ
jgi:hypothetical protein